MSMTRFRNHDFSLRQLQYAVAVAQTGGFGTAAEACAVSQPSLSAQVAKLEEALGVQLFERHSRGIHVTGAGAELLVLMRRVLDEAEVLSGRARSLLDPWDVTLRIGVIPTVAPYLLPAAVEALRTAERAPRIHWLELQTRDCEAELASGELDAMLIADPESLGGTDHAVLGWEPFFLVVPADREVGATARLEEIAADEVLLLEDGHCLRDQALELCLLPETRESPFRATSLPTLVQMVAAGLGVSVLPASAVSIETSRAKVKAVPFASGTVGRELRLVWRSRTPHAEVLAAVARHLRDALEHAIAE